MERNEEWFLERVGKNVVITTKKKSHNGEMPITDTSHARSLHRSQKTLGYTFSDPAVSTDYLHFYLGVMCQTIIDGVPTGFNTPLTRTMLFDQLQQKLEYSREVILKPLLRPLAEITRDELAHCEQVSELSGSGKKTLNYNPEVPPEEFVRGWSAFEPKVMAYLLKTGFDLFGLIKSGAAVNASTK